jgi:hypothetical protein
LIHKKENRLSRTSSASILFLLGAFLLSSCLKGDAYIDREYRKLNEICSNGVFDYDYKEKAIDCGVNCVPCDFPKADSCAILVPNGKNHGHWDGTYFSLDTLTGSDFYEQDESLTFTAKSSTDDWGISIQIKEIANELIPGQYYNIVDQYSDDYDGVTVKFYDKNGFSSEGIAGTIFISRHEGHELYDWTFDICEGEFEQFSGPNMLLSIHLEQ